VSPASHASRGVIVALLAARVLTIGGLPTASATTPGEVAIGQTLHDAMLQGLNGPARPLSAYRGRPLVINVWASWCAPCRQEMASLERLAWHDAARGFEIIGISTDDDAAAARDWLQATNATLNQFIDSRLQLENMLGAARLPLTVLVSADGRVLAKIYGAREWDSPESLQLIATTFRRAAAGAGAAPGATATPGTTPGAASPRPSPARAAPR